MSPSQKDDDGQEWKKVRRVSDHYVRPWDLWFGNRLVAVRLSEADIDAILADHRDAQQLRERVRVLEEALREAVGWMPWRDADRLRALLSPAAATEGGEGA